MNRIIKRIEVALASISLPMGLEPCADFQLGLNIKTAKSLQKSRKQFASRRKR